MKKPFRIPQIRKEIYSIKKIMKLIKPDPLTTKLRKSIGRVILDNDSIKIYSLRLNTFKHKGIKCVNCGIEGSYFRKEKDMAEIKSFHLNLYAVNEKGEEVLMTKDHIVPKSKGGKDTLTNMQTMCFYCNQEKGNQIN